MASTLKAPPVNASRAKWVAFVSEAYPDVDTDDMDRPDLIELHKLRKAGSPSDSDTTGDGATDADERRYADQVRVVPQDRPDFEAPTLDDVPESLRFSTDTGEETEVERIAFAMDDEPFWLYKPSDAAMRLYMAQLLGDDPKTRMNAMTLLVQQALDTSGLMYVQDRVTDKRNKFDDGLYAHVVAAVLDTWGEDMAAAQFKALAEKEREQKQNRAQRRAAARQK
ncbi:tail assembly chaperone [Gordonia phage Zipp]|uniref:Tail assembly chaperone n=1 Tax=Gordonia phage Zipp TaxID=2591212 RepID=A0A514DHW3_9CAUD|nr:tail assembly chaperone [Gordonia phage Zipp]QDH93184.1 tail assembly chaperone [Gordonia phage Zipp]